MKLTFQHNDAILTLEAQAEGEGYRVRLPDGSEHLFTARRLLDECLQLTIHESDGQTRTQRIPIARTERGIELSFNAKTYAFAPVTEPSRRPKRKPDSGLLTAPMVGVVADVLVTVGQEIKAYQPVLVIEAMKVMATIDAPFAGTVKTVSVRKGERVAHGAPVAEVVPIEQAKT